jgi:CubicO group peptidase (beta-lactamase class C family)
MHYVSIDTHVVGMVLRAATGKRIEQYFADKLWSKLGTESEAIYITASTGEPMVLGGLNIITRDYARMGKLYRDNGVLNGEQLVPLSWIEDSLNNNESHLKAERRADNSVKFGYGYQWWIPLDADQEFLAIGIYGQYIYVNKKLDVVIVKNSADTNFMANGYESKVIAVEAFRAIAKSLN